jgi:hypothetical protein
MNVEELKARLRALLHQRDMLRFERDSLELFDLLEEVDEEIQELQRQISQFDSLHSPVRQSKTSKNCRL